MKAVTITQIKKELNLLNEADKTELLLKLARFKKDNKELLTYLLFEAEDENGYIELIKEEIDYLFSEVRTSHYYYMRKGVRKVLSRVKKYIRYSKLKTTEAALLLHFCENLKTLEPSYSNSTQLRNVFDRQVISIQKAISTMHEDLQYDYHKELESITQ